MKIIGLTGGIGSGKSTIARIFENAGIPVFYADLSGRNVLETDPKVREDVSALFGSEVYFENGKANRALIASVVFSDSEKLSKLNQIIHPAVARDFKVWIEKQNAPYIIREAAILFESGTNKDCDKVICVVAEDEVRINRVMSRDKVSNEEVLYRMAKQMPQTEKAEKSDFVIQNNGDEALIPQVMQIHQHLLH